MANAFSTLFGSSPSIMTQTVTNPLESAVANPLSSFLASQVGTGLPQYGGQLTAPLPSGGGAGVSDFLSQTPQQLFAPIASAAETQFQQQVPDILENYAGGLSSSGAAQAVAQGQETLSNQLATEEAQYATQIPQEQFNLAQGLGAYQTQADQAEYQNWWNSLAQNNPDLGSALSFLTTGAGQTTLSGLNPGSQGILPSLIGAAGQVGSAIALS